MAAILNDHEYARAFQPRERRCARLRNNTGRPDMIICAALLHEIETLTRNLRRYDAKQGLRGWSDGRR